MGSLSYHLITQCSAARCHSQVALFSVGDERFHAARKAKAHFIQMRTLSSRFLPALPEVLQALLEYSVFLYEIEGDPEGACTIAKEAFDAALDYRIVEQLTDKEWERANRLMQSLRDKLTEWTEAYTESETEKG